MTPTSLHDSASSWGGILPGMCDPLLALCSMLIGGSAAYVILSIAERMRAADKVRLKWRWLSIGAAAAGLEIWALHFIGNLAFCPQTPSIQDVVPAVASVVSAGTAGAVAVYFISSYDGSRTRLVCGGLLMGTCVSMVHFTSLLAMRQLVDLQVSVLAFVLSILMSVALGIAVILLGAWNITYGGWRVTEKASAMGLAISGAHFTGMIHAYSAPVMTAGVFPHQARCRHEYPATHDGIELGAGYSCQNGGGD